MPSSPEPLSIASDSWEEYEELKREVNLVIERSGWKAHPWIYSDKQISNRASVEELAATPKILGLHLSGDGSNFIFKAVVNLSKIFHGSPTGTSLTDPSKIDEYLTSFPMNKRLALRMVAVNWDPLGGTLPIKAKARLTSRRSLLIEARDISWD